MATQSETLFETVDRIITESGGFYRPLGGRPMEAPAPTYRTCPVCDGATIHADRCPASADPTLTATWGTLLKQTADELEAVWRRSGGVVPNRHVEAARKLLGE
jgi:hypothetical protein